MDKIQSVLKEKIKPKEKVEKITKIILEEPDYINNLILNFRQGTDVEKGTYATVLKEVSSSNPDIVEPLIDELIEYIDFKANRVKWGIPETFGNLAKKYPKRVEKAIPKLLENTQDKSTVVRWCAAYALSNIAIHNHDKQEELVETFYSLIDEEKNNGVKNVYLKALKQIKTNTCY
jgi:hypothetical protein